MKGEIVVPLKFVCADIASVSADAIVSPCSPHPIITESLNGSIYRTAGDVLLAARKEIGALPFGHSAVSPAFGLCARYVIHVAVPLWQGGIYEEINTLRHCYETIFLHASRLALTSLAIPLLGYGTQGFPYEIARNVFFDALINTKDIQDIQIYLVSAQSHLLERSENWQDISDYVSCLFSPTNHIDPSAPTNTPRINESAAVYRPQSSYDRELTSLLSNREKSFSAALLTYIKERELKEPTVYKKANIDRKLFSKIKTNPNYQPTKATALAFAIALELTLSETNEFLRTAGYTLTYSSKFDIIIEYFILKQIYDIFTINEALFAFGEPSLGSF